MSRESFTLLFVCLFFVFSCNKEKSCENCHENQSPIANAGPDQTIPLTSDNVVVDGSASSDPDGTIISYKWTKIAGNHSAAILQPDSRQTAIKQLTQGIYQIELNVTDDKGASARDTIRISVGTSGENQPPVANAGPDQTLILPVSYCTINGSYSYDPDGIITSYQWSKISGPYSFVIHPTQIPSQNNVTGFTEGVYQFELKITDNGGLTAIDTVQVTVRPDPGQQPCDNSNRSEVIARLIPIGTLSKPREGMAIAAAGNKILFAGGAWTPDCPECWGSTRVDIYDVSNNSWSTAELSKGRWSIGAVASGNKIFFAGGQSGDGANDIYYTNVDIYDASTNKWTIAHLSEARGYLAAGAVGDKVIFAGGEKDWNYTTSDRVDVYEISTDRWTITNLSEARSDISAVTVNNKIYFAGGDNDARWYNSPSRKIDIYDNTTALWSTSNLNEPMHWVAGTTLSNKIYWAAGCTVEIKDVTTGNSTIAHPYKPIQWEAQAVVKDNYVILLGQRGSLNYPDSEPKFDIYNTTTNTWSIGMLPSNIMSAISLNNIVYASDGIKVYKLEF